MRWVRVTAIPFHTEVVFMSRKVSAVITALALLITVPLLSACHTTTGAGQDISATGHAISNTAKSATP
jgi:predicted small secreted protein